MNRFMLKVREFLFGRNGLDRLNLALLIIYVVISAIASFSPSIFIRLIPFVFLGLAAFRFFSRNLAARHRENDIFISFWSPLTIKIKKWYARISDTTHKYYKCPKCRRKLRVPKFRGKIEIVCPECGSKFVRNTGKS